MSTDAKPENGGSVTIQHVDASLATARTRIAELEAELVKQGELCISVDAGFKAQVASLEAERDAARAAAAINEKRANGWRAEVDEAVGLILDGMKLTFNPPEHRVRWCERIEASGLLRVRPRAALDTSTPGEPGPITSTVAHVLAVECPKCDMPAGVLCDDGPEMVCVGRLQAADGLKEVVSVAATPAAPLCAAWCGQPMGDGRLPVDPAQPYREHFSNGRVQTWWCSIACSDAGRPLHPHPTCGTAAFFTTHQGPECPECKSIMIPHGVGLRCVNCGCMKTPPVPTEESR